jgi:predicted enzyme related to lactoylglutathione lyase
MIKEIAFTAYPAKDVAGLRKWYEENLGLRFNAPFEENGVEKYNEAPIGNGWFSVLTEEWADREPGSASGVFFEVDNMDDAVKDLRAKGIEVEDPYETPVCKLTSFKDLEGNKVSFHQITVPH